MSQLEENYNALFMKNHTLKVSVAAARPPPPP